MSYQHVSLIGGSHLGVHDGMLSTSNCLENRSNRPFHTWAHILRPSDAEWLACHPLNDGMCSIGFIRHVAPPQVYLHWQSVSTSSHSLPDRGQCFRQGARPPVDLEKALKTSQGVHTLLVSLHIAGMSSRVNVRQHFHMVFVLMSTIHK